MTIQRTCPDPLLFSQLLDRELAAEEEHDLHTHLETCLDCSTQLAHLSQARETLRTTLRGTKPHRTAETVTPACLSPTLIAAYVQKLVPATELGNVEQHLQTCNVCLGEVMEALQITTSLKSTKKTSVPAALSARVAAAWKSPVVASRAESLSKFVLQIAQKGLQLVEQHLVEPLREAQLMLSPMPAYRAGEEPTTLDLRLDADQATIALLAAPDGKGMALKMTLLDAGQQALPNQRIFLRQGGKSIFSARTDQEGMIRLSHLEPGSYEIACTGIQTTFVVELRA